MAAAVNFWLPLRVSTFSLSALIQNYHFSYPSTQTQQPQTRSCLQKITVMPSQSQLGFYEKMHFPTENSLEENPPQTSQPSRLALQPAARCPDGSSRRCSPARGVLSCSGAEAGESVSVSPHLCTHLSPRPRTPVCLFSPIPACCNRAQARTPLPLAPACQSWLC